jgi:hypothetical protein
VSAAQIVWFVCAVGFFAAVIWLVREAAFSRRFWSMSAWVEAGGRLGLRRPFLGVVLFGGLIALFVTGLLLYVD